MALSSTSIPGNLSNETTQQSANSSCGYNITDVNLVGSYILIISILGIIFNVFVLMVFCFHKKPCTVAEIYLSNLSAADLLLTSFLPFWAAYTLKSFHWPFGNAMCRIASAAVHMNAYCSNYFLVLVSMDRYLALVHPLSHERLRTPGFAKFGCFLVWAFGLLLTVPTMIFRSTKQRGNASKCGFDIQKPETFVIFEVTVITFSFVIPICIIFFCTVKILKALNNRMAEGVNAQKMENKATTLVLVVLLAFLICWMPYHILRILNLLNYYDVVPGCDFFRNVGLSRQFFNYFAYFNSILNPILYVIVGKNFRKKVRELFKQWNKKRTSAMTLMTTSTRTTQISMLQQKTS